jgi:hypothetical protein
MSRLKWYTPRFHKVTAMPQAQVNPVQLGSIIPRQHHHGQDGVEEDRRQRRDLNDFQAVHGAQNFFNARQA